MTFLGTHKITPAHTEIEVECFGETQPAERQTLEHSGCGKYAELIKVTHNDIDISDYLCSDVWDELEYSINHQTV